MKRFHRDVSIDMVIHMGIFKNNQNYALSLFHLHILNRGKFLLCISWNSMNLPTDIILEELGAFSPATSISPSFS